MAKTNVKKIPVGAAQLAADITRPTRQVIKRKLQQEAARFLSGTKETRQSRRKKARDVVHEVMKEQRGKL